MGKCYCQNIHQCINCEDEEQSTCSKCEGNLKINTATKPQECVSTCPSYTYEHNGKCHRSLNFVQVVNKEIEFKR